MRQHMDHLRFHSDLDFFYFTEDKLPELPIKTVKLERCVQRGMLFEFMIRFRLSQQTIPVTTQSIIADMLKQMQCLCIILDT